MTKEQLQLIITAKDLASATMSALGDKISAVDSKSRNLAQQGLKYMEDGLNRVANTLKATALTAGSTAIAIAGYGFNLATSYEAQLSNIQALTGATADQMKQVSNLSMTLGAKTKYSALEAAQGAEELLKAGVSLEQVMGGGLAGALDLAAAGGLGVADAAEIASTALNAFSKDGLSVSNAADILAGAANASATSVQELRFGLSMSAAVAAGVGMTFKDTSTALAVFAQNGLKGSDAGTSLKTMLMNLQPATKKQQQLWDELGLSFYDSQGKMKPLSAIADELKTKFSGMTDAQRAMAFETAFGSDAIRAANILYKEGAEGVANMTKEMGKFTAADVAAQKTNNLAGAFERIQGTIDTKLIQLFMKPLPALVQAVGQVDSMIQSIDIDGIYSGFEKFYNLVFKGDFSGGIFGLQEDSKTVDTILDIRSKLISLYQLVKPYIDGFKDNILLQRSLIIGFAAVVGTVLVGAIGMMIAGFAAAATGAFVAGLPILALIGIAAALYYAWQENFGGIQEITQGVIDKLVEFSNATGITDALFGDFTKLKDTINQVKESVIKFYQDGLQKVTDFINKNMQPEIKVFNAAMELLKGIWENLVMAFNLAMPVLTFVAGVLWWIASNVIVALMYAFEQLRPVVMNIIESVLALAKPIIDILWPVMLVLIGVVVFLAGVLLTVLMPAFQFLWAFIVQVFAGVGNIIAGIFTFIAGILNVFVGVIKGIFTGDFSQAAEGFKQIWNGIVMFVRGVIQLILAPVRAIVDGIANTLRSVNLWQIGVNMMQGLINGIRNMAGSVSSSVRDSVSGALDSAKRFLGIRSPSRKFRDEVGVQIPAGAAQGIEDGEDKLVKSTQSTFRAVVPAAQTATDTSSTENNTDMPASPKGPKSNDQRTGQQIIIQIDAKGAIFADDKSIDEFVSSKLIRALKKYKVIL